MPVFRFLILLLCLALVGCGGDQTGETMPDDASPTPNDSATKQGLQSGDSTQSDGKVEATVEYKTWTQVQNLVAASDGKLTVIDLWSLD